MSPTLLEEIILLTLDDNDGTFVPLAEYSLEIALGAAVLMDLALQDRIDTDLTRLMVTDDTPTGDDLLDTVLAEIKSSTESQYIAQWLERLSRDWESLRESALDRLVDRGILRKDQKRFLWVFGSRRYPVIDNKQQREAKLRIMAILLGDEVPDPRDIALVCAADACAILESIMSSRELRSVKTRIDQVIALDLIGQAMAQEIRKLRALKISARGQW
jgi:hypothetical protein